MIDRFTKSDLVKLIRSKSDPCVTIYLSTEKTGREIFRGAKRLKQLAAGVEQKLSNSMNSADVQKFLQPFVDLVSDKNFWQTTDQGLALFRDPSHFHSWRVTRPFTEQVFVSDQYFIRPILRAAERCEPYFILALSQNYVEMFEADQMEINPLVVPNMPESIAAGLNLTSVQQGSQVHTGAREFHGKQARVFHGHGGKRETAKEDARQFYRQVNHAVRNFLKDERQPLILACVADQAPIYREVNTYRYLLDPFAAGSPDQLSRHELHQRALPVMNEQRSLFRQSEIDACRQKINTPWTLSEASSILTAAHQGQVDNLFVHEHASIPGVFHPTQQNIDYTTSEFDQDLVEVAIAQTLLHHGDVLVLLESEMPLAAPMVATLRY